MSKSSSNNSSVNNSSITDLTHISADLPTPQDAGLDLGQPEKPLSPSEVELGLPEFEEIFDDEPESIVSSAKASPAGGNKERLR